MSLLVPLILAVIFLVLQMVLYAHDTVWADAWICTKNQESIWQQETGRDTEDFTAKLFAEMPRLVVLRLETANQSERKEGMTTQAVFRFCLLPEEVRLLIPVFPETVERQVTDCVQDLPGWMRKTSALTG